VAHHRKNTTTEKAKSEKNMLISASMSATREKRKTQFCKVITAKIQFNKLNQKQKEALKMLFIEAKWIRNEMIAYGKENNIFDYKCGDFIQVMNKVKQLESRERKYISAQQIQSVIAEVKDNLKSLYKKKQKGKPVGSLKFCSEVKSIDLKQHGATYKIKSSTKVKIQGIAGDVKVNGLEQLDLDCDFANAKLICKPDGYYIAFTTYMHNSKKKDTYVSGTNIGIDMGVKTNISLSTGEKINVFVEESERLKNLQKQMFRRQKGSNNRNKTIKKIQKEYQKINNIKNDKANKIVSELKKYETIYFQDENISAWRKKGSLANGSKKIQHSILGRVKMKLKNCERAVMLDRFIPTTQTCKECGTKNKHSLADRVYRCECGYENDRDVHSAQMMILFGKSIGTEHTEFKPVEMKTSAISNNSKLLSKNQEASKSLDLT
jgi:putative transposase